MIENNTCTGEKGNDIDVKLSCTKTFLSAQLMKRPYYKCNSAIMTVTENYYTYDGYGFVASMTGICGLYMVSYNCSIYGELKILML